MRESSDRSGPVGRWVGADFTRGGFWRRKKSILNINFCLYDFATRVRWAPAHRPTGPRMTCATVEVFRSGQRGRLRAVDCENVQNSWLICIYHSLYVHPVKTFGFGSTLLQNGGAVAGHSVGARGAMLERGGVVHGAQTGR